MRSNSKACVNPTVPAAPRVRQKAAIPLLGVLLAIGSGVIGCNGLDKSNANVTTKPAPATYMAPVVLGGVFTANLQSYLIDDAQQTFQQLTYSVSQEGGSRVNNSGTTAALARGLLELTTNYSRGLSLNDTATTTPQSGSWAIELAGQAGGLVQLYKQPFTPLAAASACPSSTKPVTYQYLTIPAPLFVPTSGSSAQTQVLTFNPALENAYGSVDISATGSAVALGNIKQSTLPGIAGSTGAPANPSPASANGTCTATPYGNTVIVPGQLVITNPGNGQSIPGYATIGIGPSGLLVEDNGAATVVNTTETANTYQNSLGAGTGAIGLPKPSSAVDTGSLVGAQYLGFFYGAGFYNGNSSSGWSSSVASFGFPTAPASCASVTAPTQTLIYGGDFANNDPSSAAVQAAGGFGNCDYAIDLGAQDSANNGLYPSVTVWVGAAFAGNTTGTAYSYPAVAIAGQVGGKNAIFVLGVDTTGTPNQATGIYLLQTN